MPAQLKQFNDLRAAKMENFSKIYPFTFQTAVEGGYTHDAEDAGCWTANVVGHGRCLGTNFGVSAARLLLIKGPNATVEDMKKLTKEEAIQNAKTQFYDKILGDDLPIGVDLMMFDMFYNSGTHATRCLQSILHQEPVNGVLTKETIDLINNFVISETVCPRLSKYAATKIQSKIKVKDDGVFGSGSFLALAALSQETRIALYLCGLLFDSFEDFYVRCNQPRYIHGWETRNQNRLNAALALITI